MYICVNMSEGLRDYTLKNNKDKDNSPTNLSYQTELITETEEVTVLLDFAI